VLAKTLAHFWPRFRLWLGGVKDTRDQTRITYGRSFLAWMGLMLFLLRLGARRQVRPELDSPEALENLNALSGCRQEAIAHGDTLDHFLGHVPPGEWSALRRQMVYRLIRMKALDSGRLFGHFLVVVDGTGQLHFSHRHCDACLERTVSGKTRYYHQVLEAKLVTPEGLAISLGSEFIENADPRAGKQDCELKAFARLARRLKKDYPQLLLCFLLDAIYAKGPVFALCRENHWKFLITFKEGSLPALWQEYQTLRNLCPANRKSVQTQSGSRQEFAWVESLLHVDEEERRHCLGALECREENGREQRTLFAWLTNFPVNAQTVASLGNRGGRMRWKIENEGFNIQKNGGFALEHAYSHGDWQIKGFYLLLQIAHLIGQLIERGSLLGPQGPGLLGGLRSLARRLAESLRNRPIPPQALDPAAGARIQIRLNSS
jgi:hypothetical protein